MPAIYLAALFTTVVAVVVFVPMIRHWAPQQFRNRLCVLGCVGLLMSPLAYFCVRLPLMKLAEPKWFTTVAGEKLGFEQQVIRDVIRLTYAPLTEETAKIFPWCVGLALGARICASRRRTASLALTLGVSFAVGEFWLVAYFIHAKNDPTLSALPWYAFGGYMGERIMTCFGHTLFVLPTVWLSRRGRGYALLGLMIGMSLHYLSNSPIALMGHEAFGLSKSTWGVLLQFWLVAFVIATLFALIGVHYGSSMIRRVLNQQMVCPECKATYKQPIFQGLNMGTWRYEPCGVCKKWHWVTLHNLAPLKSPESPEVMAADQATSQDPKQISE